MDRHILIGWYKSGYYTSEDFKTFVLAKWITVEDYENTTGLDYETGEPM